MVKIEIRQFERDGATVDKSALEQFQQQWTTYQKLVDADYLSHAEVARLLHTALDEAFEGSFSFLDIACGDASEMRDALRGTRIRRYLGIDLSEPALELAAANLKDMPFTVELDHCDFVETLLKRPESVDASWCSLSIHHLSTDAKLELLQAIKSATARFLMIYEPTRNDGESREAYLARFERVNRPAWTNLSPQEWAQIDHHVTTCDFPETASGWLDLGRDAGFRNSRVLFEDPTGFYRLYRYDC